MRKITLFLILIWSKSLIAQDIPLNSNYSILGNSGSNATQLLYWNGSNVYYGRKLPGMIGVKSHFFRINGETKLMINELGKVGIGTIEPDMALSIDGGIGLFRNNQFPTDYSLGFLKYEDGLILGNSSSSDPIRFQTNSVDRFYISNSGNIGIGTSTPKGNLQFEGQAQRLIFSTDISQQENSARIEFWETNSGIEISENAQFSIQYDGLNDALRFKGKSGSLVDNDFMIIKRNGQVGIGTELDNLGNHKLAVEGSIGAREIKVESSGWSDFVFNNDYELKSLEETEQFILKNNHLPDIPNEKEVEEEGINLGQMDAKLLQKIEELTLYLIEQNKLNNAQQKKIEQLEMKIIFLEKK
ncbi:hypothetical protein [Saccharicrinis fermentans]|uniref:Uncharacterized protein n=1 Tax=Saccharicrinis fermentans DSM 9555 = JCM 21142 TaxID=869213 RepID=W7YEV7_9BACT|nr:hypothetical protein [Saccharicrinis fermentans]GAF06003.1 hypothetical protein JCM21142_134770 [Saccharicrinis fermentans DSM 9555 = JCM 21142]